MNNKLNTNFSLRKLLLTALVAGPLATLPAPLWALPDVASTNLTTSTGVTTQVVGTATLNITAPDKAILTWQAFGSGASTIAAGDVINYFLPSSTASVLNSVSGGVASTINGSLISNGNVYVLNPSGIVIGATAQINTGGFYASTVAEPSGFFSINGSLSFAGTSTSSVTVTNGATVQAVGTGNNIYLAGNAIDVQGGTFYGNLFTRSSSTTNPLAGGYSTSFGSVGAVDIRQVGNPLAGGGLNVTTGGGNVNLSGVGALTIAPSVSSTTAPVTITTVGNGLNGTITQGAGAFTASTTGSVVTLNAGTGTTAAAITLNNVNFLTVGATGSNISLNDTSGGIVLNAITATGTLGVTSAAGITQGTGTHSVGGLITLTPTGSNTVSFTGTGNLTFANIATTSTITLSTTGDITLQQATLTATQPLSITSTGGQITAGALSTGSTLTISATSSAGKLTATSIRSLTGTVNVAGDITLTGVGTNLINGGGSTLSVTSSAGSITVGGVSTSSTLNLTSTAGSITAGAVQTNTLNITAANGSITTGASTHTNSVTISAGSVTTGTISSSSAVTITATTGSLSTGNIATSSTLTLAAPSASGSVTTGTLTSTTTRTVSISAGGTVNLNALTTPVLSVVSTAGSITQSGAITSTGNATFNAASDIVLTNVANNFTNVTLIGGASAASGISVVDANDIIIGTGTATKAATTITAGAAAGALSGIALGANAVDVLNFGSTLALNQSNVANTSAITTNANTVNVFGTVTVTTFNNNSATLGSNIFGNAANYSFGQINGNVGTGSLNVYENQTLNLGNITAANLDARSLSSNIVNTGKLAVTGNAIFAANSIFSPGTVSLTNGSNALSGTVLIGNATDFTLVNTVNTTVTAGTALVNGKAASGTTSVTVTGAGNTLTINTGAGTGGDYNIVSFSAPGAVTISDPNSLTLQNITNTGTGAVNVTAAGAVTLGSGIALASTGATNITSTGASAAITDSAPNIRIFGPASFTSDNSISITNAGHSLGAVSLATTGVNGANGTANITYTEGGSANLNVVSVNTTANAAVTGANLSVTSTGGDIIQTTGTGTISVGYITALDNTSTFTSNAGKVTLTNPAGTNSIATWTLLSAVGNSSIAQANAVSLGNVAVTGGTFAVDTSAAAAKLINQRASSTIKSFGNTSFTTQAGTITLDKSGNNFGGLTLVTNAGVGGAAGANIAITEAGTINFVSVNAGTAGKLTAISENGAIIQSGTGGITVGGATSLTAGTAGITLNTGTTNNLFGGNAGIVISTTGNASVQDSNTITALGGGSTVGGTLTLKNTQGAIGQIKDTPGNITVTGNVLLDTTTAAGTSINLGSSNLSLGAIQFRSGSVTIVENASLNLAAGSVASGAVSLTSSGNITTTGAGGGTFQNTLALNASGSITITNPIFVNGAGGSGLTFRALGAVDLSALSLAGNLNSIAPTNLGASSYKAPSP